MLLLDYWVQLKQKLFFSLHQTRWNVRIGWVLCQSADGSIGEWRELGWVSTFHSALRCQPLWAAEEEKARVYFAEDRKRNEIISKMSLLKELQKYHVPKTPVIDCTFVPSYSQWCLYIHISVTKEASIISVVIRQRRLPSISVPNTRCSRISITSMFMYVHAAWWILCGEVILVNRQRATGLSYRI